MVSSMHIGNSVLDTALNDYDESIVGIIGVEHLRVPKVQLPKTSGDLRSILVFNSINYRFWDLKDGSLVRYQNMGAVGALGARAGFEAYMSGCDFSMDAMRVCFGDITDIEGRFLRLEESMGSNAVEVIEQYIKRVGVVDVELAGLLADLMPLSYKEPYLKKIQLALYEVALHYNVECRLTIAADYQLPKVLEGLGVLRYSEELSYKIANSALIEEGSAEERAIRAATVLACERISRVHSVSTAELDRELWLSRNNFPGKNFHLTITSNY